MTYPLLVQLDSAGIDFTCFGHPWVSDIFSATRFSVIGSPQIREHLHMCRQYRQGSFTHAILCPSSLSALIPTKLANVSSVGQHFMCSERVRQDAERHRVEQYHDLGRSFFGNDHTKQIPQDFIPLSDLSCQKAKGVLKAHFDGPFVVFCPFATNLHEGQNKEWPHWRHFVSDYRDKPLLGLVAPQDVARFKKEFPGTPVISESLSVTAAIMREADHVVTNDSGAMHLAAFFGAQVLGLLGVTNALETRPWHGHHLTSVEGKWATCRDVIDHLSSS